MTNEERKLWYKCLRELPIDFHRQKMIGNYIVDFYCAKAKIAIELDGSQHFDADAMEYDKQREKYLNSQGITVIRYNNIDINTNFKGVYEDIMRKVGLIQ